VRPRPGKFVLTTFPSKSLVLSAKNIICGEIGFTKELCTLVVVKVKVSLPESISVFSN